MEPEHLREIRKEIEKEEENKEKMDEKEKSDEMELNQQLKLKLIYSKPELIKKAKWNFIKKIDTFWYIFLYPLI